MLVCACVGRCVWVCVGGRVADLLCAKRDLKNEFFKIYHNLCLQWGGEKLCQVCMVEFVLNVMPIF